MATKKPEIKFYADPDIQEWLSTLPAGARSKSAFINKILRAEKERQSKLQGAETQAAVPPAYVPDSTLYSAVQEAKRFIEKFEIDNVDLSNELKELQQWKEQTDDQLDELIEWRQAFPEVQLFEHVETEEVIAALELLQVIGKEGIVAVLERSPELEKRLDSLEDQVAVLLSRRG